jgi:hypothetical protein
VTPAHNVVVKPLPFNEAVAAFERRAPNLVPSDRWTEMWQEDHAVAFTVARSAGYDILGDIRDALDKALKEGLTYEQFAARLKPILQAKGWWGKVERPDGEIVQLGSMRRLRTIYNTNLRVSYAAGAWERAWRTQHALPYIVYEGIDDAHQRPIHHSWMGTCLLITDPWWDTHWCPCGWNCRCWNRQVTRLEAREIGVTENPPSGPPKRFFNPSTGETVEVPYGIDPGFGYNVGKASMAGQAQGNAAKLMADKMAATPPRVAALPLPKPILDAQVEEFGRWVDQARGAGEAAGDLRVAGALSSKVLDFLERPDVDRAPASGAITVAGKAVHGFLRDVTGTRAPALALVKELPRLLAEPAAILWDREQERLVYVTAVAAAAEAGLRLVIVLDPAKARSATNAVAAGQLVALQALQDRQRYELVEGEL